MSANESRRSHASPAAPSAEGETWAFARLAELFDDMGRHYRQTEEETKLVVEALRFRASTPDQSAARIAELEGALEQARNYAKNARAVAGPTIGFNEIIACIDAALASPARRE